MQSVLEPHGDLHCAAAVSIGAVAVQAAKRIKKHVLVQIVELFKSHNQIHQDHQVHSGRNEFELAP
jgi:hypothetical protein